MVRSNLYYTEAMELVGGLHLRFFQRSPFYEFARFQLQSSRPDHAKAALRVMWSMHGEWSSAIEVKNKASARTTSSKGGHLCFVSDFAFIEQQSNEAIQSGDLQLAEGDARGALKAYLSVLDALKTNFGQDLLPSTGLREVQARCYRRVLHLKTAHSDLSGETHVDKLVSIAKKLDQCMRRCENRVERVKGMVELSSLNLSLLRSLPSRAIMSLEQTVSLLEEAYGLGDHLGLSDVNKRLRASLGAAYMLSVEAQAVSLDRREELEFLSWASAILLANSSVIERSDDVCCADGTPDLELEKCLEQLSSRLKLRSRTSPRTQLKQKVSSVKEQIRHLPSSWLVASVAVSASSELVVSRIVVRSFILLFAVR